MNENITVEIVQFTSKEGIDEKAFLQASDAMMMDLKKQDGFIDRELLKSEDNQWVDVVHWKSLANAELAAKNVMNSPTCLEFFQMMDQDSVKMMHFERIRRYE